MIQQLKKCRIVIACQCFASANIEMGSRFTGTFEVQLKDEIRNDVEAWEGKRSGEFCKK